MISTDGSSGRAPFFVHLIRSMKYELFDAQLFTPQVCDCMRLLCVDKSRCQALKETLIKKMMTKTLAAMQLSVTKCHLPRRFVRARRYLLLPAYIRRMLCSSCFLHKVVATTAGRACTVAGTCDTSRSRNRINVVIVSISVGSERTR